MSDEEKACREVGTAHAVSHTKSMYETVSKTFDPLQKGKNCVFATNNRCRWNLGAWLELELKFQSEIWKEKNSPRPQKFWCQASKVKQMMIMAHNYTGVTATYTVPYGRTYTSFAKFWGLTFDKCIHKCSIIWSFSITKLISILQHWLLQFFKNMAGNSTTIHCAVLIRVL